MKLSELRKALPGVDAQTGEYLVVLVDLDRVPDDEVDVVLSPLRELEVDAGQNELRLYSAAQRPDADRVPPPSSTRSSSIRCHSRASSRRISW